MFKMRVYEESIEMVRQVTRLTKVVERHDPDLARQMRRASRSVPLQQMEGFHGRGRNRAARLQGAMAEAKEVVACLDVAVAAECLQEADVVATQRLLDGIAGSLWKLIHRPRR